MNARRRFLIKVFKIFDLIIIVYGFVLSIWLASPELNGLRSFEEFLSLRMKILNFVRFAVLVYVWHILFRSFGLYKSWRLCDRWRESIRILEATTLCSFVLLIGGKLFSIGFVDMPYLAVFWISITIMMVSSRLTLRWGLSWIRRRGRNIRFMLIAGTGRRAVELARTIVAKPELGYRISGFVDSPWEGMAEFRNFPLNIVTDFEGFSAYLRVNPVDEVVIALPLRSKYEDASRIAFICKEQGIVVRQLSDCFDLKFPQLNVEPLEKLSLVALNSLTMDSWQAEAKRLLDVLVSALALLILSPVFVVIGVAVKMSSSGPVFFSQRRIGLNKRRIRVFKFRTMVMDAEKKQAELESLNEAGGPVFKIRNDPRITRLGKVLRKTSLDELPQFFNVLIGDMSLVGPRPLPLRDYNGFSEDWQRRRFSVRPGITCLWQIKGRNTLSFQRWMELDMEYIDGWNLWLDIKILIKTIPIVLRGTGAA